MVFVGGGRIVTDQSLSWMVVILSIIHRAGNHSGVG